MSEDNNARAKMLGDLIKQARMRAERSVEECAQVIDTSADEFDQVERGDRPVSLPDLEALAIYLGIPMGYFWGTETLDEAFAQVDFTNLIALRHRVIGVLLRQLRLRERRSQEELAEELGIEREQIQAYETGTVSIPFLHLELLSKMLGVSVEYFVDSQRGPLGRHEAEQRIRKLFHQMSPELQGFLLNPVNVPYLRTAWRLSEMDVDKLREIAENLLDITL